MVDPYWDFKMPEVEQLAKAICKKRGFDDPETKVPETGYANARAIPIWWKYQDDALNFLAMVEAKNG